MENRFAEILGNLPKSFCRSDPEIPDPAARRPACSARPIRSCIHCAQLVLSPSAARDRLTPDLSHVDDDRGLARLEKAFLLVTAAEELAETTARRAAARLEKRRCRRASSPSPRAKKLAACA
jgi:acyl-CoA dehydrogenase